MREYNFGRSHVSFHTPGHSGEAYKGRDFFLSDVTELSFTDNLLCPSGKLKEFNEKLSSLYGADFAYLSTNGATACVTAAVSVFEGTCLVIGGAHRSLFNAVRKNGGKVVVAKDLSAAKNYLRSHSVDYAFSTYPDYFGEDIGIKAISDFCREKGVPLIIDSAHGSHFVLSPKLPVSATEYGDLVIYSLHKTLPVLTGGAVLTGRKEYSDKAFEELISVHSTSPSFMILESVGWFLEDVEKVKAGFDDLIDVIGEFRKSVEENTPFRVRRTADATRIVIETERDGYALGRYLESRNIFVETAYSHGAILIATPYNMKHLGLVAEVLKQAPTLPSDTRKSIVVPDIKEVSYYRCDYESVAIDKAVGRRLFGEVGAYPTGAPSFFFGDTADENFISFCKDYENFLFGACNGKVFVIK